MCCLRFFLLVVSLNIIVALCQGCDEQGENTGVTFELSTSDIFAGFDTESSRESLLRHLCASSKWRVTNELGAIVAERVVLDGKGCRTGGNQVINGGQVRVAIRFGSYTHSSFWFKSNKYSSAKAGDKIVDVKLVKLNDHYCSFLIVRANGLFLQITESNLCAERILTKKAISETAGELSVIRNSLKTLQENEHLNESLPPRSRKVCEIPDSLQIMDSDSEGIYHVSGYINAMEPGYITFRTFDTETGREIAKDQNMLRTVEYVGWSANESEKFYFESEVILGGDGSEKNVRFEVWFHPTGERKMLEKTKRLATWVR